MSDLRPATSHIHAFNFHTGRPRFHFDENPPPPAPPPAPPPPAKPWHDGVDAEILGHWQNKGWKVDDPKEIALAATKQAREAERHFGVPVDRLLKLPAADARPEEITAFRQRLGAPKEASEYDLSAIKEASIADALRATAHAVGIPKDAAAEMAKTVAKALESKATADTTVNAAKVAEEKTKLESLWPKDKYNFNLLQANEGAARSGITPEAIKAMENQVGYAAVMEHFRRIGANTSEATFVEGGPAGHVATREGAMARKAELMADPAWSKRWTAGDVEASREYNRLMALIGE